MNFTEILLAMILAALIVGCPLAWMLISRTKEMRAEVSQLSEALAARRGLGGSAIAGQLANSAEELAYAGLQQKKAEPFERLEKPLYAMHQQIEELLTEIRGLRSDIDEFLTAHRKTLKVLLGQDEYDGGDPDQKAEEDEVARLLRRYPQLSRNDALARVREQAQYKVGRG